MPYRMKPHVECLIVKDQQGILWHHYQRAPAAGARNLGPIIGWIGDEYRERWLRLGLVEEIADDVPATQTQPAPSDGTPVPNSELVDECIATLDRFEVPPDAGAPTARAVLRDRGQSWGNDTIAAAIRARKARAAQLSRQEGEVKSCI